MSRGGALRQRTLIVLLLLCASLLIPPLAGAQTALDELLAQYQKQPNNAVLCEQLGLAYARGGDFNSAVGFLRKAVRLNPDQMPARKNLATVLWFAGRKSESADVFSQLEKSIPGDPVPQLYLGLNAYEHQNFKQAAAHFEHAGTLASHNPEVVPILIETYLSAGRFENARQAIKLELAARPRSAELLLELGLSYAFQGDFKSARQPFLDANVADPRWSPPLIALGVTDLQTGSASTAADYFEKAKLLAPRDYRCYYLRAIALKHSQTAGDPKTRAEELKELKQAALLDSSQASTWTALGEIEMSAGRDAEAEVDFHKALEIQPDESTALYKLALLCRREGKTRQSEALLAAFRESKRKAHADEVDLTSLFRTVNSKQ